MNIHVHRLVRIRRPVGDAFRHQSHTHTIVHRGVGDIVATNFAQASNQIGLEIDELWRGEENTHKDIQDQEDRLVA